MKSWYETRLRLLLLVAVTPVLATMASDSGHSANLLVHELEATNLIGLSMVAAILLAGAGIKTQQAGLRAAKGLHGSMYYTLSLPVTRRRLFGVRVSLGLAETAFIHAGVCCAAWLLHPQFRLKAAPVDVIQNAVAAFFLVAAVYSLGVFFATFLDDVYQTWASLTTLITGLIILKRVPVPRYFNSLFLVSSASPLLTHRMPWLAMAIYLGIAAALLAISLILVRSREY